MDKYQIKPARDFYWQNDGYKIFTESGEEVTQQGYNEDVCADVEYELWFETYEEAVDHVEDELEGEVIK